MKKKQLYFLEIKRLFTDCAHTKIIFLQKKIFTWKFTGKNIYNINNQSLLNNVHVPTFSFHIYKCSVLCHSHSMQPFLGYMCQDYVLLTICHFDLRILFSLSITLPCICYALKSVFLQPTWCLLTLVSLDVFPYNRHIVLNSSQLAIQKIAILSALVTHLCKRLNASYFHC